MEQHQNVDKDDSLKHLGVALHELCQPVTALQCRLELAELVDSDADYREAVSFGLAECARLANSVVRMREILRSLLQCAAH